MVVTLGVRQRAGLPVLERSWRGVGFAAAVAEFLHLLYLPRPLMFPQVLYYLSSLLLLVTNRFKDHFLTLIVDSS